MKKLFKLSLLSSLLLPLLLLIICAAAIAGDSSNTSSNGSSTGKRTTLTAKEVAQKWLRSDIKYKVVDFENEYMLSEIERKRG